MSCSPSFSSSSPLPPDCSSLIRSLWTDLSSDITSISTSISSWLSPYISTKTSTCTSICHTYNQKTFNPQRLSYDAYMHWYQHHKTTYITSIHRLSNEYRHYTYLIYDDEYVVDNNNDDIDDDITSNDEYKWNEDMIQTQTQLQQQRDQMWERYTPVLCTCQQQTSTSTCTCQRSTSLLVASVHGIYQRSSLKHDEFIHDAHLGVATDDHTTSISISTCDTTSSDEISSYDTPISISLPSSPSSEVSSPHPSSRSSSRCSTTDIDDTSDIDMDNDISSPSILQRCDSTSSLDMEMDTDSDEIEAHVEYLDVILPQSNKDMNSLCPQSLAASQSALRRRSSSQHLTSMSRSTSLHRFDSISSSATSTPASGIPKTRRLISTTTKSSTSTCTSPQTPADDVLTQLWEIQDGHQLHAMQRAMRDTTIVV